MQENLVYLSKKSTPITNSRKVAEKFRKEHRNILRDIDAMKSQLTDNQHKLRFELMFFEAQNEVSIGNGAIRKDRVYVMNQDGFTLLTMGFTGSKAMQFKLQYIAEFNRMKTELERKQFNPANMSRLEILQLAIESEKRAIVLEAENKQLVTVITEQAPKVEAHDTFINADGLLSIEEAAKSLGSGKLKMFKKLKEKGILMKNNIPYQQYINRGFFTVKQRPYKRNDRDYVYTQTFVTPSGLTYLSKAV